MFFIFSQQFLEWSDKAGRDVKEWSQEVSAEAAEMSKRFYRTVQSWAPQGITEQWEDFKHQVQRKYNGM